MNPKVSICVPTYNRKDYLRETLDSIFAQTYKDYEVVVVDDGSTDGTAEMLKAGDYPLRYYWQKNSGDAAARNEMIKLALGEFITFIDSDDLLMHDAVERMTNVMQAEGGEVIAYGPYLRIDQNGHVYGRFKSKLYSGYIAKYLFRNIFVHSCGSMFPKSALEEARGFDTSLKRCSVYKLLLKLSLKYRFIALHEPVFKRRRHTGNIYDSSLDDRKIEYEVLENFYVNGGGKGVVPHRWAMKRLSQEGYRAGRAAIREKKYNEARRLLSESFGMHPNIKSLIHWSRAATAGKLFV
jgi:glycosyltransferase involved in cell wall biosynthesis